MLEVVKIHSLKPFVLINPLNFFNCLAILFFAGTFASVNAAESGVNYGAICEVNSDCPSGSLCRSISGGGAKCIYEKSNEALKDKGKQLCQIDSDCQKGFMCRSVSGGGSICREEQVITSNDGVLSEELIEARKICGRKGLNNKTNAYKKCLDMEFEKIVEEQSRRISEDNLKYQELIRQRTIEDEKRRLNNLDQQRRQAAIEDANRREAAAIEAAERRRQAEVLLNLGLGIMSMGANQSNIKPSNCFLKSNITSGFHKTCIYSCPTGNITSTVGAAELCPLTR